MHWLTNKSGKQQISSRATQQMQIIKASGKWQVNFARAYVRVCACGMRAYCVLMTEKSKILC